jgi:hypothetical protein
MYSAPGNFRAVLVFLSVPAFSCVAASPQTSKLAGPAVYSFSAGNAPAVPDSCFEDAEIVTHDPRRPLPAAAFARSSCEYQPAVPSVSSQCSAVTRAPADCGAREDPVRAGLEAIGKDGGKILRARERALEILESDNACTGWYREKDANPATTFRTLSFALDRNGEGDVRESPGPESLKIFRSPYVARVIQADGTYATITINAHGAFFASVARVVEVGGEGGPFNTMRAPRQLYVGPYAGNTLAAQVVTLLHEFGHLVDLLPSDEHDQDGKSVHNTDVVLQHCRAEIESRPKRNALIATR